MQPVCRQRWEADNAGSAPPAKILFQTGCNKMRAPRTPPNNHKGRCHFCSLQTEAVKQHDCRPSTPVMHLATLPHGGQARCWPPSRNPPQTARPPQHVSQSHHGRGLTAVAAAVPLPHNRQTTQCPFSAVVASTITLAVTTIDQQPILIAPAPGAHSQHTALRLASPSTLLRGLQESGSVHTSLPALQQGHTAHHPQHSTAQQAQGTD